MHISFLAVLLPFTKVCLAHSFDYVIVGAGTAGLLLANRLSANPNITVAVIDPGTDQRGNSNVTNPALWQNNRLSGTNWNYTTVPQTNLTGRTIELQAGRGIGGTSLINGMTMIRGDLAQFDAWQLLGNPGWNASCMFKYMKRAERFYNPNAAAADAGATFKGEYHGYEGDLRVGFNPSLPSRDIYEDVRQSWAELGQTLNKDVNGGYTAGFDLWPQTIDPEKNIRWDAATAFYWPVAKSRKNLKLIHGTASHIVWHKSSGKPRAKGVVYHTPAMQQKQVNARREVVISAGTLRTPLILERSGIGNPDILHEAGIDVVVANPGVGEHLIDQVNVLLLYQAKSPINGTATYSTFVPARDIYGHEFDSVAASTKEDLPRMAAAVASRSHGGMNATALEQIFRIQHDVIFNQRTTAAEIITTTMGDTAATVCWELLPFWRGSVHVSPTSPGAGVIDPRFFSLEFDIDLQTRACRLARRLFSDSNTPAAHIVAGRLQPTEGQLPLRNPTEEQWRAYMASTLSSNQHGVGTASMMARELGGVVDSRLRVWGAGGVRVVDGSVVPMQVSGHLTGTVYAVAERAAEMMMEDWGGR